MSDQIDIKPIAFITGYVRGYLTIKTLDPSLVLPPKMALYSYEDVLNAVKAEREACADIADQFDFIWETDIPGKNIVVHMDQIPKRIRARGEVK